MAVRVFLVPVFKGNYLSFFSKQFLELLKKFPLPTFGFPLFSSVFSSSHEVFFFSLLLSLPPSPQSFSSYCSFAYLLVAARSVPDSKTATVLLGQINLLHISADLMVFVLFL